MPVATSVGARLRHGPWSPVVWLLATAGVLLAAGGLALAWRSAHRRRRALAVARAVLATCALSLAIAQVVRLRANAYFTPRVLWEGMLVVALAHLAATLLALVARLTRRRGAHGAHGGRVARAAMWLRGPVAMRRAPRHLLERAPPTAERLGDVVTGVVVAFVAAHWVAAALGYREAGLVLLMTAGAAMAVVLLLRVAAVLAAFAARGHATAPRHEDLAAR